MPADDGWRRAGAADLLPGRAACRDAAGVAVLLARAQDGRWFAVAPMCSHAAMSLAEGRVRGASIVCPHHGARFDLATGRALGPPATVPIAAWLTRVEDGEVFVCLN